MRQAMPQEASRTRCPHACGIKFPAWVKTDQLSTTGTPVSLELEERTSFMLSSDQLGRERYPSCRQRRPYPPNGRSKRRFDRGSRHRYRPQCAGPRPRSSVTPLCAPGREPFDSTCGRSGLCVKRSGNIHSLKICCALPRTSQRLSASCVS
jgi:hypothetical protein